MQDKLVRDIWQRCADLILPVLTPDRYTYIYFEPNTTFSDSWIRVHRRGTGPLHMGRPSPDTPVDLLEINVVFKPGVIGDIWEGYTIGIANNNGTPELRPIAPRWMQDGATESTTPGNFLNLYSDYLFELFACPHAVTAYPREAPTEMF